MTPQRINRLLSIHHATHQLNAVDQGQIIRLAADLACNWRTIYRDLAALRRIYATTHTTTPTDTAITLEALKL
jgi:hypothetical protein